MVIFVVNNTTIILLTYAFHAFIIELTTINERKAKGFR